MWQNVLIFYQFIHTQTQRIEMDIGHIVNIELCSYNKRSYYSIWVFNTLLPACCWLYILWFRLSWHWRYLRLTRLKVNINGKSSIMKTNFLTVLLSSSSSLIIIVTFSSFRLRRRSDRFAMCQFVIVMTSVQQKTMTIVDLQRIVRRVAEKIVHTRDWFCT